MNINEIFKKMDSAFEEKKNLILSYLSVVIVAFIIFYNFILPLHEKYNNLQERLNEVTIKYSLTAKIAKIKKKKKNILSQIQSLQEDLKYITMLLATDEKIYCDEMCKLEVYKKILDLNTKFNLNTSFVLKSDVYRFDNNLSLKKSSFVGSDSNELLYEVVSKNNSYDLKYDNFIRLVNFIKGVESLPNILEFEDFKIYITDEKNMTKKDKNIYKSYINYSFKINLWSIK